MTKAYYDAGRRRGRRRRTTSRSQTPRGRRQVQKGFEIVNAMPYEERHRAGGAPRRLHRLPRPRDRWTCASRGPGSSTGSGALAESDEALPAPGQHRALARGRPQASPTTPTPRPSRQEMRTFVCGQCHVEYYFKGEQKLLTYPWHDGIKVEDDRDLLRRSRLVGLGARAERRRRAQGAAPRVRDVERGVHARSRRGLRRLPHWHVLSPARPAAPLRRSREAVRPASRPGRPAARSRAGRPAGRWCGRSTAGSPGCA